jgi:tetratricopeptide (TPR) repeat protein
MLRSLILSFAVWLLVLGCGRKSEEVRKQSFLHRGNLAVDEIMYQEALRYYAQALEVDPDYIEAHNNRGIVYIKMGKFEEAVEALTQAIQLDQSSYDAHYNRAKAYFEMGDMHSAISDLAAIEAQSLAGTKEQMAKYRLLQGIVLWQMNKLSDARFAFHKALHADSANAEVFINLANVLFLQDSLPQAERSAQQGIALNAQEANGYNVLGMISTTKKNYDAAEEFFDRALELDRGNPYFLNNRGLMHTLSGNLEKAKEDIDLSLTIAPENPWVYRNRGIYYWKANDYARALKMLRQASDMEPMMKDLYYYTGEVHLAMADRAQACQSWADGKTHGEVLSAEAYASHCAGN